MTDGDHFPDYIEVRNVHGQVVRIPRDSLMASAFELGFEHRSASLSRSTVELSLGVIADLFWARMPEVRPHLKRLIVEELDTAIESDDLPGYPSQFEVMLEFILHVLAPAIHGLPETAELVTRCIDCLEALEELRITDADRLVDILDEGVYRWMHNDGAWAVLEEGAPNLAKRLKKLDPYN